MGVAIGRRLLGAAVAVGAGIAALQGGTTPAAASCLLQATYLEATYIGVGSLPAADVGGVVGPGTVPACNDTPGSGIDVQPTPVNLLRVPGVAPRFAVALPSGAGAPASLVVADGTPCLLSTVEQSLACLRRQTVRLLAGPALITVTSVTSGAVISVAVHVRDRALRRRVSIGADTLLQRRDGGAWRSVAHLAARAGRPGQVQLPVVAPGLYRVGKRVTVGSRPTWLFATLTILPPPPPCTGNCTHG